MGRKRHLLVDTLGLIIVCVVHAANQQDRDGAKAVFGRLQRAMYTIRLIWADGAYSGALTEWVSSLRYRCKMVLEIVRREKATQGFEVLPKRWIVERTFAWLGRYRRLSKDYEQLTDSGESMIYVAMIGLMARRLARCRLA